MRYEDFIKILKDQIASMSYERQVSFALKICKELFFDYHSFYEVYNFGDADVLLDAINYCDKMTKDSRDIGTINEHIAKVNAIIPKTEGFANELESCAVNAASVVVETLKFFIDSKSVHIYDVAIHYVDTSYFKINDPGVLTTETIDNHPVVLKARNYILAETI